MAPPALATSVARWGSRVMSCQRSSWRLAPRRIPSWANPALTAHVAPAPGPQCQFLVDGKVRLLMIGHGPNLDDRRKERRDRADAHSVGRSLRAARRTTSPGPAGGRPGAAGACHCRCPGAHRSRPQNRGVDSPIARSGSWAGSSAGSVPSNHGSSFQSGTGGSWESEGAKGERLTNP